MAARDSSGVRFPPPLIYVVAILAGSLLQRAWPLSIVPLGTTFLRRSLGWLAIALWLALMVTALRRFSLADTSFKPTKPTKAIVAEGPYRFTRNPMYLGFVFMTLGIALLANWLWLLLLVPVVMVVIRRTVIDREERYLEMKFGDAYLQYKARVRRWL